MSALEDDVALVRRWFQRLQLHVQSVDFAGARPLFADDLITFGSFNPFTIGREANEEEQWRTVWGRIDGFRWRLDELRECWDSLMLRAHVVIDGERVLYQEGALALMRTPDDLMQRYGSPLKPGTVMMSGTLNAIGGIRPASRFEMQLEDPAERRSITHAYDVADLPVIA